MKVLGFYLKKATIIAIIIVVSLVLMGTNECSDTKSYDGQGDTQRLEAKATEDNQARLIQATPPPMLIWSLERDNLNTRLTRFNDADKISYIYLISNTGVIMSFMPIKGKVSSVNSRLTTGEQIVDDPWRYNSGGKVVESPQLDGSYGTNGDAIFFFTTEDVYLEWNGLYMLCDQPLKLSTPPLLVYTVKKDEM